MVSYTFVGVLGAENTCEASSIKYVHPQGGRGGSPKVYENVLGRGEVQPKAYILFSVLK